ncbi:DUF6526 family protein [Hymenobacter cavernae]|uniref:PH domain-containing protein n=1 Tax=Hymenobacter cavernae TaxID=2044852 RepID=A0ABQ1UE27_9BACT|nr:DUF6526 family protein [Hymenobacter cavernae]GGF16870.1 hypothetical protein GCM10011383_30430 [Hymenobacter cavernae]
MADSPTKNTVKYYPLHHFILLPAALIMVVYTVRRYLAVAGDDSEVSRLWFCVMALAVIVFLGLVMLRQHYALTLQNRLIRLEVRQRYFEVTGKSLRPLEDQLTLGQIFSLRFAGDQELPSLVQAAIQEKLPPKDIQARIQDFHFDTMRV